MTAKHPAKSTAVRFPESAVRKTLSDFWKTEMKEKQDDPFFDAQGTLYDLLPPLGSLAMVRSLNAIAKILKMKIPVRLIKKGGYDSHDEMINDLLPKLRELYEKRN